MRLRTIITRAKKRKHKTPEERARRIRVLLTCAELRRKMPAPTRSRS